MKFEKEDRLFWWTIEDIKNYLDYSEDIASKHGYNPNGLRIYLGAYPDIGKTVVSTIKGATVKASTNPFGFVQKERDCPKYLPLNKGIGGQGDYP